MANEESQIRLAKVKGSDRIQINNILAAACVTVLSVVLSVHRWHHSTWMVLQLAAATPMLVTSSLAYAKIGYRASEECRSWDRLGWLTHTLGYVMILNAVALLLHSKVSTSASLCLIAICLCLFTVYSAMDIHLDRLRWKEKAAKLVLFFGLMVLGAILPISAG